MKIFEWLKADDSLKQQIPRRKVGNLTVEPFQGTFRIFETDSKRFSICLNEDEVKALYILLKEQIDDV